MNYMRDELGDVVHCEVCEAYPAVMDVEDERQAIRVCGEPDCRLKAMERLVDDQPEERPMFGVTKEELEQEVQRELRNSQNLRSQEQERHNAWIRMRIASDKLLHKNYD